MLNLIKTPLMGITLIALLGLGVDVHAQAANDVICNKCIGPTDVASKAFGTAKIDNKAVTAPKLANKAVTSVKINSQAVTTGKIADGAVTIPKVAPELSNALGQFCIPDQAVVGMDASGNFECELPQTLAGFGTQNTRAGPGALANNATGVANSAFGDGTLNDNTDGESNSAFGVNALGKNITGSFNSAFGVQALFANTTGVANAAFGNRALGANTTANGNGAFGFNALRLNTTGHSNSAFGSSALRDNTTGAANAAFGTQALFQNAAGAQNTAIGNGTLFSNITGSRNTAVGDAALSNSTGTGNIALGKSAGADYTTGNDNIAIGHSGFNGETTTIRIGTESKQFRAFIQGIRSITTGDSNAIPVLIDGNGQLGTTNSSRRYKEDILDMNTASQRLLSLRPVTFRYKQAFEDGEKPVQYGLIAEEVAEVFPELVAYDTDGVPASVKYHLLSTLLLNELQKQQQVSQKQAAEIAGLQELEIRLAQLEMQMADPATVAGTH